MLLVRLAQNETECWYVMLALIVSSIIMDSFLVSMRRFVFQVSLTSTRTGQITRMDLVKFQLAVNSGLVSYVATILFSTGIFSVNIQN